MHYGMSIGQISEGCSVQSNKYILSAFYATNTVLGTVTQRKGDGSVSTPPAIRHAGAKRTQKCTMTTDRIITNTNTFMM